MGKHFGIRPTKFAQLLADASKGAARGLLGKRRRLQGERLGVPANGQGVSAMQGLTTLAGPWQKWGPRNPHGESHPL